MGLRLRPESRIARCEMKSINRLRTVGDVVAQEPFVSWPHCFPDIGRKAFDFALRSLFDQARQATEPAHETGKRHWTPARTRSLQRQDQTRATVFFKYLEQSDVEFKTCRRLKHADRSSPFNAAVLEAVATSLSCFKQCAGPQPFCDLLPIGERFPYERGGMGKVAHKTQCVP